MREIKVGDIWMWSPNPSTAAPWRQPEYWLMTRQDSDGGWLGICLSQEVDLGPEELSVGDYSANWEKVA